MSNIGIGIGIGIDQFGRTITGTDNGDGTTTYSDGDGLSITRSSDVNASDILAEFNGLSPSVGSLSYEKQDKLIQFNNALETFVANYYDLKTQFRLKILYDLAVANGLTNRAAYLLPLLNWVSSLVAYSSTFTATVLAQSDPATTAALNWDFTQLTPPNVTLLGAISILN